MSDDLNPDVQRLVNLARAARTPGDEDKLRLAERLAVSLAASAALGTAAGTAKAAASTGLFSSLAAKVAAVVVVGAVGGAVLVSQLQSRPERAPALKPSVAQPQPAPAPLAPSPAQAVAPTTPEALPSEPATPLRTNAPSAVHSSKPEGELALEASLLHEAQSAWRAGQSAKALELASQHAQRFPHSQLANERDVLRVLSLCKLGQAQAAKQVGARLLRTAKGSPWYQSVAESCAGK